MAEGVPGANKAFEKISGLSGRSKVEGHADSWRCEDQGAVYLPPNGGGCTPFGELVKKTRNRRHGLERRALTRKSAKMSDSLETLGSSKKGNIVQSAGGKKSSNIEKNQK